MAGSIIEAAQKLIRYIDGQVAGVEEASKSAQQKAFQLLRDQLLSLEIRDGRFIPGQNLTRRLAMIEEKLTQIVGSRQYAEPIREFLGSFTEIEASNLAMQKTFNEVELDAQKLRPARKFVLDQASYYLEGAGLHDTFIQPAKYLMMQQVTTGITIEQGLKLLDKWNAGELTDGKLTNGRQTPSLDRYATQISRDNAYQYNGTVNDIIRRELDLTHFIYTGDVIRDTRPLCRHLVQRPGPIPFEDLPKLLKEYPQGTIEGTNQENFTIYRGGYNCRHTAVAVRK